MSRLQYQEVEITTSINIEEVLGDIKKEIEIDGILELLDEPDEILEKLITADNFETVFDKLEALNKDRLLELAKEFIEENNE